MSGNTVLSTEFNGRNVTVSQPKAVEVEVNGKRQSVGKKAFVNYNGERLRLQSATSMRIPFGLSIFTAEGGGQEKHSINLSFTGYQAEGEVKTFYDAITALDAAIIDQAVANSKAWFGKVQSKEVISAFYTPSVKFGKDTSKDYPPTMKLNLRRTGTTYETKFYDTTGKPFKGLPVTEMLAKGSQVTALMECSDVWIAATGKFNLRWNVTQLVVHKVPDSGADFAFRGLATAAPSTGVEEAESNQVEDAEEESTLRSPSVLAAVLPPAAEEEAEEEEAPPPVPAVKITKKKPVVIAKKA
jgi:hypothetical protein